MPAGPAEIVGALEEEIALGRIGPRARLVEDELMQRFNTKRHIARQALVELEGMGVGRGLLHLGQTFGERGEQTWLARGRDDGHASGSC